MCIVADPQKREIILDSSKVYLKGTPFHVSEDCIPKQQEVQRKQYTERLMRQGKLPHTQDGDQNVK